MTTKKTAATTTRPEAHPQTMKERAAKGKAREWGQEERAAGKEVDRRQRQKSGNRHAIGHCREMQWDWHVPK